MKTLEIIRGLIENDKKSGMSYSEIARKIGVSKGNITIWLYDDVKPSPDSIRKVSAAYGISVAELMGEEVRGEVDFSGLPPRLERLFRDVELLPDEQKEDALSMFEFYLSRLKSKGR